MPTLKSIDDILQIARISQLLAQNAAEQSLALGGSALDNSLGTKLYIERMAVQNLYNLAPNSTALRPAADYLYALCGIYALQAEVIIGNQTGAAPVVTGPSNQTVASGGTATFGISVDSALPYSVQWYKNGAAISGQTTTVLTFTAQLSDSGATYYALVTNAAGNTASATANLTVTNPSQVASYFYGDVDYYTDLLAGNDNISYNGTTPIVNGQPINISYPIGAANNKFNGIRFPTAAGAKTAWFNTPLNSGQIPDSVYRDIIIIGSNSYIISRNAMSLDTSVPVIYS